MIMNILKSLLEKNAGKFDRTFIVTESVFSMDGDVADLNYLVELKKQFPNTYLMWMKPMQ